MKRRIRLLTTALLVVFAGSLYADDLTIDPVKMAPGSIHQISIKLQNESEKYIAFQFDLVLPDGITALQSSNRELLASLNFNRFSDHELHTSQIRGNTYRFLVFSMTNAVMTGQEADLIYLKLSADKEIESEPQTVTLKSILFIDENRKKHKLDNQTVKLDITTGETSPVTIGASGKSTYCGRKSLDFSYSDDVKAYVATGYDKSEGIIWLTRVKDVPAGTPVLVKGEANQTYDVPVVDSENSYYENMFVGNTSGETLQIGETDGDLVNYYLSSKDGTFKSVNKSVNIGPNKSYLQLPDKFAMAEAGDEQHVTMASTGKSSYAAPVDLDFTNVDGLKAFTATGYDKSDGTIWLSRVMKVQKGEGLLLKGEADKDYVIPSTSVQSSYKNMFIGNISGEKISVGEKSADGLWTYYYLSGKDGTYKSVNKSVNIGDKKSYLRLPTEYLSTAAGTRGIDNCLFDEAPEVIAIPVVIRRLADETTGIKANIQEPTANIQYHNLQGQRVDHPRKGIYIQNGRKVVIR